MRLKKIWLTQAGSKSMRSTSTSPVQSLLSPRTNTQTTCPVPILKCCNLNAAT